MYRQDLTETIRQTHPTPLSYRLKALCQSKRFAVSASSVILAILSAVGQMDPLLARDLVLVALGWVLGDSVRPTTNVWTSRRFWAFIGTTLGVVLARFGLDVDPSVVETAVLGVSAWLLGNSCRTTLPKQRGQGSES